MKKFSIAAIAFLIMVSMILSLFSCSKKDDDNETDSGSVKTEISDDNDVDEIETDDTVHNYVFESSEGGSYTYRCSDCDETATVSISCSSGSVDCASVDGNTITFAGMTEESVYSVCGDFYGNVIINAGEYKFELEMTGFSLTSYSESPIVVTGEDKVILSAKKDTANYIYDMRAEAGEDEHTAAVYAECDINVQGKGSLYLKSSENNGIHAKDDLKLKNLFLQIECSDNALKGNDGVTIESGTYVLISSRGDGIKTTNSSLSAKGKQKGSVDISGGDILIYAACDGIDSAYDVNIGDSVELQIFTDKYSKYSEEVTYTSDSIYYVRFNYINYSYSIKYYNDESDAVWYNSSGYNLVGNYAYYPITKPDGYSYLKLYIYNSSQEQGQDGDYTACTDSLAVNDSYDTIALMNRSGSLTYGWTNYTTKTQGGPGGGPGGMGMNDGNSDKGDYSTKGIKAANSITVTGGNITVKSYDDSIHANGGETLENNETSTGNITIGGGNLTLYSNDDGIHADGNLTVSDGTVSVINSYEGLEGSTVTVSGGTVYIVSSDDGINGVKTTGESIVISGGTLYVYAGGDGLDSNSTSSYDGIVFSGGRSVIISTGNADSSIDTENGYKYEGGYVLAVGKSGGMSNEATKCSPSVSSVGKTANLSVQSGAYITVGGYVSLKMPVSMNASVIFLGDSGVKISSSSSADGNFSDYGVCWSL